jgi:predicted NUDIX family NTP pyrophosphohydrolase
MKKISAGILLFRHNNQHTEYLLVHFGGPFWKNKTQGAWSIPKGECEAGEEPFATAIREFREETGFTPQGQFIALSPVTQKSGKIVYAWAVEQDVDAAHIRSNLVTLTDARTKKQISFPEIDKAGWFSLQECKNLMVSAQFALVEELSDILKTNPSPKK